MDNRIKILFERYQQGTATADERKLVDAWYESHYGQQGKMPSRNEETNVFGDLDARIAAMLAQKNPESKTDFRWMQVAAIFIALLGAGLYGYHHLQAHKIAVAETYTEINSPDGQKKNKSPFRMVPPFF